MATIQKRGNRYRVQIRRKGQKPQYATFECKAAAKEWAKKAEQTRSHFVEHRASLAEALKRYLKEITPTKKGVKQETNRIKAWLRDPMSKRSLSSIKSMDIAEWRNKKTRAGKAPTTIKNALSIISQTYVMAATEWGMEGLHNPVRGVRMPKARPARDRRLLPGEEARLMEGCDRCGNAWIGPIASLAIETAMRQGELLGLHRTHIRENVAYLPNTKNEKARSVPLSTRAVAILSSLPVPLHGPIFQITQDSLEYYWRKACSLAKIEGLTFHDLRHEATSRLFELGLSPFEVMAITGHSTTDMLKRYTHFFAKDLAAKLG